MLLRDLPTEEQAETRLLKYGPAALTAAELLTLLLDLKEVGEAEAILADVGNVYGLRSLRLETLLALKNIGPRKALRFKAGLELGLRIAQAPQRNTTVIKSPADAANLLMTTMSSTEQEEMWVLLLDARMQILKQYMLYRGTPNEIHLRVADVFREAVRMNAAAILIAHSHPSGDPTPSPEDVFMTRQIVEAGKLMNIDVLDHLVIGQARWVSLKERGLGF